MPIGRSSVSSEAETRDEVRLAELGYKQELKRDWGLAQNFGVSQAYQHSAIRNVRTHPKVVIDQAQNTVRESDLCGNR